MPPAGIFQKGEVVSDSLIPLAARLCLASHGLASLIWHMAILHLSKTRIKRWARCSGLAAIGAFLALPLSAASLTVFAASSTKNAIDEVAQVWTEDTSIQVRVSYAGSSALARQISQGAPADIFISANTAWMDVLEANDLLADKTRADLLGNTLVLISPVAAADQIDLSVPGAMIDRLRGGKLAMALVKAVPAGIYGKQALETLGLWNAIAPHVAQTDNVRSALALAALGEAPMAIVYASEAAAEPRVKVIYTFAAKDNAPITYPVAAIDPVKSDAVTAFLEFLQTDRAVSIYQKHGFTRPTLR